MITITELLGERLNSALTKLDKENFPSNFKGTVSPAADTRFGDYQTNAAMILAKEFRMNPRDLAVEIIQKIDVSDISDDPEIAGPGFINFKIHESTILSRLKEILSSDRVGVGKTHKPEKILIDFSSPNIAKPMHIGHIRSTIIGDCLQRVANFLGHEVTSDNHIGDWGTPIGQVIYGWKNELNKTAFDEDPIKELLRLYQLIKEQFESNPNINAACLDETVKLQSGNNESIQLWNQFKEITLSEAQKIYDKLAIKFNLTLGESFYHDQLAPLVDNLLSAGIAEISDGAVCIFSNDELEPKNDPLLVNRDNQWTPIPCMIRKKDGGFNYATTDIATIDYRVNKLGAERILYVVDDRQSLHFRQLFEVSRQRKIKTNLEHVSFGKILGDDRKPFKTREGSVPDLSSVLNEAIQRARLVVDEKSVNLNEEEKKEVSEKIGLAAVKYFELSQSRVSDYIFSWDKMLSLQGNTAPYMINAYVRTRSIFRKINETADQELDKLEITDNSERAIGIKLCQYAEIIPEVMNDYRPNLLATYLYELAQNFHSFYEQCPVLSTEGKTRNTRLALCESTSKVLKHGLELLGIYPPDKM
ncbi:MAG: arginine--tRNA ligase [Verrucomicrobiales bacterium]|nr:arginine--tRNA ligase [Verrucomicrobiales bacterium]MBD27857.1 arginine--tRNA ligase [Verrucomicrobiaceae bacterium]|tara:strand:- start:1843 stop:3606 length:1764 start_codon:yes stop_codon:yes gene_type:complete